MPDFFSRIIYQLGIAFYNIAIALLSPFYQKAALLRKGRASTFQYLTENTEPGVSYVWFHAASLGEFEQGRPLMEALKQQHPQTRILLTFFSPSGFEIKKNYAGADLICYLPADTAINARKLMQIVTVSAALFIKYEFWANYLTELNRRNIPVYSVAAIFRSNQFFFKSYGQWYRRLLQNFNKIFVQDNASAALLKQIGVSQVIVAGDTRFDRVAKVASAAKSFPLIEKFINNSSLVIVAGSSWPADEELLSRYLIDYPQTHLIVVPHEIHESHLAGIAKKFPGSVRYTQLTEQQTVQCNCLIIDTIGMLSSVYRYAAIAYIGGGFGVGIHNTLEAAVWSVPVVFGPSHTKFREACELIETGGAISVGNYADLSAAFNTLKADPEAGKKAGNYVQQNTGATSLIIEQLTNDLYAKTIDS